jgi:hypothetical protein
MTISISTRAALAALAACATMAQEAAAQSTAPWPADTWRFGASLYIYGPKIDGSFAFPKRSGNGEIIVDGGSFFDSLEGAFMGAFEAHNGRWGIFTDFLYVDVSGSSNGTRDFSIGGSNVPGSVTADLNLGVKGSAWTIAGEYRLQSTRESTVDLLFGARVLDIKPRLSFGLNGDLGNTVVVSRSGNFEVKDTNWDAIVGVKGRFAFGDQLKWFAPYYADIGTGESRLTWQAAGGIGYAFDWGDIVGMWRYMRYDMKSGDVIQDLSLNGPMLGVTFRW